MGVFFRSMVRIQPELQPVQTSNSKLEHMANPRALDTNIELLRCQFFSKFESHASEAHPLEECGCISPRSGRPGGPGPIVINVDAADVREAVFSQGGADDQFELPGAHVEGVPPVQYRQRFGQHRMTRALSTKHPVLAIVVITLDQALDTVEGITVREMSVKWVRLTSNDRFFVALLAVRKDGQLYRESIKWTDKLAGKVLEVVSAMRVVKYFCYEGSFLNEIFNIRKQEPKGIKKIQHSQSSKTWAHVLG
ncbi:hypothetical protein B0H14DRAFT_3581284 [Mycena olivaceomarginata]|nr:hypothetical protein B0H14DRAFT_3581284 [Mycena olivaceomarginata]